MTDRDRLVGKLRKAKREALLAERDDLATKLNTTSGLYAKWLGKASDLTDKVAVLEAALREIAEAAKTASALGAAPDYDEEAITEALWEVVARALAAGGGDAAPGEPISGATMDLLKVAPEVLARIVARIERVDLDAATSAAVNLACALRAAYERESAEAAT